MSCVCVAVSEVFDAIRLILTLEIIGYASILDWRTRKVPNKYWIAMSVLALALMSSQILLESWPGEYLLILIPIMAILADVYLESPEGVSAKIGPVAKYIIAVVSVVALGILWGGDDLFRHLLAVPVMMLVIVVFYMLDIIKGGADAKALLAISIMFPFYPAVGSVPLASPGSGYEYLFPFSLAVLITAAILVAIMPVAFLAINISHRDLRFPQALLGYKVPAYEVAARHVWLMERVVGEKHVVHTRPKPDEDISMEVERLVSCGHGNVWVTPKIPFMIPLLGGLVIAALFGNILLFLFPI